MHEALRRARWKPHRLEQIGEVWSEKLLTNGEIGPSTCFMVLDVFKHSAKERRGPCHDTVTVTRNTLKPAQFCMRQ